MGKKRVCGPYFTAYFQSLVQREVGYVLLPSDAADGKYVHALEFLKGFLRYVVGVGQVAQSAEAETKNRQPIVYGADWYDFYSIDTEGMLVYGVEDEVRYSGIAVVSEGVGVFSFQGFLDSGFCIYGESLAHEVVEGADVIQPTGMVLVHMCENHCVKFLYPASEHLLPEIRTGIDYEPEPLIFYVCGGSESLVMEVIGAAYIAAASYHGHSLGGACAQKFYFVDHSTPKIGNFT